MIKSIFKIGVFCVFVIFSKTVFSQTQGVSINDNGAAPNSNAILDVDISSNNKGILIPRLTTTERTNISGLGSSDEGLTVYDETTSSFWYWDGTAWVEVGANSDDWKLTGNSGTTDGTNFIGTTDNVALNFKINNAKSGRIATDNTFFGYQSGLNATGTNNAFFGDGAGYNNTTGTENVFVGHRVGYYMQTGESNTAVGYNAFYNYGGAGGTHPGGNGNVAIGKWAMFNPYQGDYNVAVGFSAFSLPNSGEQNVFIGYNADRDDNTSLNYATAIGAYASANADYATAIGYRAYADNSNTLILGQINGVNGATNSTKVGIGTTSPGTKLHLFEEDNTTSNVLELLRLEHQTTATAEDGIGVGMSFYIEDDDGNSTKRASINAEIYDVDGYSHPRNSIDFHTEYNGTMNKIMSMVGDAYGEGNFAIGDFTNPQDDIEIRKQFGSVRISSFNDYDTWGYPELILQKSRGTTSSPQTVQADDILGRIYFMGGNNSNVSGIAGAGIGSVAETDWSSAKKANLIFYTNNDGSITERTRITADGKVGIGTTSPTATLDIKTPNLSTNEASLKISPVGAAGSSTSEFSLIDFWSTFDNYSSDQAPRRTASIKAHYIGGTWGYEALSICVGNAGDAANEPTERVRIVDDNRGSNLVAGGSWGTLSDKRLKTDIRDIPYGLNEILKLKPIKYVIHDPKNFNDIPKGTPKGHERVEIGFIAQDIYKVIPNVVNKPEDESKQLWTMKYERLTPVLVKAIQEQQKEIEELKKEIEKLKKR